MNEDLHKFVAEKSMLFSDPAYVRSRIQRGDNPYDVSEIELLFRDGVFTLEEIVPLLTLAVDHGSFEEVRVYLLFLLTQSPLTSTFVPILCRILSLKEIGVTNEDIIELLGDIGDDSAVPFLVNVIWDPDFPGADENHWAAKKALIALGRIGGEAALKAIHKARDHPSSDIKDECESVLESIGESNGNAEKS